jgi:hypothetical protein
MEYFAEANYNAVIDETAVSILVKVYFRFGGCPKPINTPAVCIAVSGLSVRVNRL